MLSLLFITAIVLMVGLSVAMLIFLLGVFVNKYRRYLLKIILIAVLLFAALLLIDFSIYRSFMSAVDKPSDDMIILDSHPFPSLIIFSLNYLIPGMCILIFIELIFIKSIKKNFYFWVVAAITTLLIGGFFALGQVVNSNFIGGDLRTAIWWL